MERVSLIASVLLLVVLASSISAEPLPDANNVCNITIPAKKDIIIEHPVKYEIKYQGMCGIMPCTKTRTETRIDQTIKTTIIDEKRLACCLGYAETPSRQCAPICLRSCNNGGKCLAPNTCKCSPAPGEWTPGFVGTTCGRYVCLGENRWGPKCDKECNCPLNAYCNASNGNCLCYPGFRGTNCSLECGIDSNEPECDESTNERPLISEPDANLILENSIPSRQRSEALVLERTPDETQIQDDTSSFGANYLVGVLACISLISFIGFFIIKRRYDQLKEEVCYSSGSNGGSSNTSGGVYSAPSYYDATVNQRSICTNDDRTNGDLFAKNLSFAAATRQILLGDEQKHTTNNTQQKTHNTISNQLIVNPLVESRLMRSQKQSQQNFYADVKVDFSERPLPDPRDMEVADVTQSSDHIYQVPRSRPNDPANISSSANESPADSPIYKSLVDDKTEGEDIYEEIKSSPTKQQ